MLKISSKIICATIFSILQIYITKILTKAKSESINYKDVIGTVLLIAITFIMYNVNYSVESTIIRSLLIIMVLRYILEESLFKIIIAYIFLIFITTISELINYSILKQLFSITVMRDSWYGMLITNVSVAVIVILIMKIKYISNFVSNFIEKLNKNNILKPIVFLGISFIVILNILFNITQNQQNNHVYILDILIITIFLILVTILVLDNDKYNQLLTKYDILLKYSADFEDAIDEIELNNHEYKNQLAILRSHVESSDKKQALRIIKEMSNESLQINSKFLVELKHIPKGGIKGLIYYKVMIAEQKDINISINVSPNSQKLIKLLIDDEVKVLCKLIGVYLDNAIEAAENTEKKIVSVEIYPLDNKLNLVFSNSIENMKLNLDEINKKGISTKGEGRGKGLYLVNKLISKNNWLICKSKIINNFYVQYIEINKKAS